jgi:hypothetical protein
LGHADVFRVNNAGNNKLGDTAAAEPALCALAQRERRRISFQVCFDNGHDQLFRGHPAIDPVPRAHDDPDYTVDVSAACLQALEHDVHFGAGFYHQFGLPAGRVHFRSFAPPTPDARFRGRVLIAHNSHSCASRDRRTGLLIPGAVPSTQPPLEWWSPIVAACPSPPLALAGSKDGWDLDLPGIETVRGLSVSGLLAALRSASLLISVDTGVLHLATTCGVPVVYLRSARPAGHVDPGGRTEVVYAERADRFDHDATVAAMGRQRRT